MRFKQIGTSAVVELLIEKMGLSYHDARAACVEAEWALRDPASKRQRPGAKE